MPQSPVHQSYLKRQLVRAVLICGPAQYSVSWGSGVQALDRAHLRVEVPRADGGEPEVYGVALDAFLDTYANADELGTYRKTSITHARVAEEDFVLETERKGETTRVNVQAGDYLVQEADGQGEYHVPKAQFEAMYVATEQ